METMDSDEHFCDMSHKASDWGMELLAVNVLGLQMTWLKDDTTTMLYLAAPTA